MAVSVSGDEGPATRPSLRTETRETEMLGWAAHHQHSSCGVTFDYAVSWIHIYEICE